MRHRKATYKLGKPGNQRRALVKGLVRSLFVHEKIRTTIDRAKAAEMLAEHLITAAKRSLTDPENALNARRQVRRYISVADRLQKGAPRVARVSQNDTLIKKIFTEIAPRMKDRPGGYTRLTKIDRRRGDGATMVVLELVGED